MSFALWPHGSDLHTVDPTSPLPLGVASPLCEARFPFQVVLAPRPPNDPSSPDHLCRHPIPKKAPATGPGVRTRACRSWRVWQLDLPPIPDLSSRLLTAVQLKDIAGP